MNRSTKMKDIIGNYTALVFWGEGEYSGSIETNVIVVQNDLLDDTMLLIAKGVDHGYCELDGKHSYTSAKLKVLPIVDGEFKILFDYANASEDRATVRNEVTGGLIDNIFWDEAVADIVFNDTGVFLKLMDNAVTVITINLDGEILL